jgi:hypothetical protein
MAVDKFDSPFALIVNLDQYAGNYEREFCAYVMGAVGDCDVGREMATLYYEEVSDVCIADMTQPIADDNGCFRPVSIYHDSNDVEAYDSLIIFLEDQPSAEDLTLIAQRAQKFCAERPDWKSYMGERRPLTLKGIKLISNKVVRTQEIISQVYAKSA